MYSGHPMGLFPSHKDAPRVVVNQRNGDSIILNLMIGKNLMHLGVSCMDK